MLFFYLLLFLVFGFDFMRKRIKKEKEKTINSPIFDLVVTSEICIAALCFLLGKGSGTRVGKGSVERISVEFISTF